MSFLHAHTDFYDVFIFTEYPFLMLGSPGGGRFRRQKSPDCWFTPSTSAVVVEAGARSQEGALWLLRGWDELRFLGHHCCFPQSPSTGSCRWELELGDGTQIICCRIQVKSVGQTLTSSPAYDRGSKREGTLWCSPCLKHCLVRRRCSMNTLG